MNFCKFLTFDNLKCFDNQISYQYLSDQYFLPQYI